MLGKKLGSLNVLPRRWAIAVLLTLGGGLLTLPLSRLGLLMPFWDLPAVLCLPSCKAQAVMHTAIAPPDFVNPAEPLLDHLGPDFDPTKISILVEKSAYRLTVFYDLQPIKTYPVVFGGNPSGDKFHEGDQKTPEGRYQVRDLYEHPSWSKFIWLDYPNPQSWREHFQAKFTGQLNPLLPIGGEIGIHGVPSGQGDWIAAQKNWTLGCVSLTNTDVDEIYAVMERGTVVEIVP